MNRVAVAVALTVAVAGGGSRAAAQRSDRITVPLSDPSRPATLDVHLFAGIVSVTATEARDIVIDATAPAASVGRGGRGGRIIFLLPPAGAAPGTDTAGLTRLPQPTALDIEESNNVVSVRGPSGDRVDLTIQVPVRTSFKLKKTATGSTLGTVTVKGLDGDLEIHTGGGAITLIDVAGSVVAHSMNASVVATVRRVTPDRPMSFTSYGGNVDVTLPRSVKADFILQSDRGDVLTDFELQVRNNGADGRQPGGGFRRRANDPLRARANGGGPEFELRSYRGNVYLRKGN